MRIYGWELLTEYDLPDKFGERRHCDSGVFMSPASHVTSQNQVIEGS